jgi:virulence-associated protein VagC
MKTLLGNRCETKIFAGGNSLAVRLPVGWGKRGHTVILTRANDKITFEPRIKTSGNLLSALKGLGPSKIKRPKLGPFRPRLEVLE